MEISLYTLWEQQAKSYQSGCNLYNQYGKSAILKDLFATGESPFNRTKLESELRKISIPLEKKSNIPQPIEIEKQKLGDIIGKMSHMHAQLETVQTDSQRKELAKKILDLATERRNIFNRLDHFNKTGSDLVPEKAASQKTEKPIDNDPFKVLLRLRSQRSKLKNNPKRVADYNAIVKQIETIEKQLNK